MGVSPPPDQPEATPPPGPPVEPGPDLCPNCGAPYEPYQEYCLECGRRLPLSRGTMATLSTAWRRGGAQSPWYPGDWIWPIVLLLLIATLGGVVAYLTTKDNGKKTVITATTGQTVTTDTTTTETTGTDTTGTDTTGTETTDTTGTETTGTTETTPPPPPPPPAGALTTWPSAKSGYTIVLQSIPVGTGEHAAAAFARKAARAGLPKVGYLNSSGFSSLHPGYWVVFSGIYNSIVAARANAAAASSKGFPGAYPRQITP